MSWCACWVTTTSGCACGRSSSWCDGARRRALDAVARDPERRRLARLHGIWGMGQLGAEALEGRGWRDLRWLTGQGEEIAAQVAKVVGEARARWLAEDLIGLLSHDSLRVRFFVAQSLGALGAEAAVEPLFALLRENANRDVFLRHAAVYALSRLPDRERVYAHADDPDTAVRLAVLLVQRHHAAPAIADFLADDDVFLVAEAARAIYDLPIPAALPALASLAGQPLPGAEAPAQTRNAIERRVIGAALALGTPEAATALAAHVNLETSALPMRQLALASLEHFTTPPVRDYTNGFHRPLPTRDPRRGRRRLRAPRSGHGRRGAGRRGAPGGARPWQGAPRRRGAAGTGVGEGFEESERVASLQALAIRSPGSSAPAVAAALASRSPALRAEARDLLAVSRPEEAVASIAALDDSAPLLERQRAYRTLARIDLPEAHDTIGLALVRAQAGRLDPALTLDVMEAARTAGNLPMLNQLHAWEAQTLGDPVRARHWALAGGDPVRGEAVFQGHADCLRCHGEKPGHGGGAGPSLAGLSLRSGPEFWLRSVVAPNADVTPGFGTLTLVRTNGERLTGTLLAEDARHVDLLVGGEVQRVPTAEIAERGAAVSPMPPMGLVLDPEDLRDLIAYLGTL